MVANCLWQFEQWMVLALSMSATNLLNGPSSSHLAYMRRVKGAKWVTEACSRSVESLRKQVLLVSTRTEVRVVFARDEAVLVGEANANIVCRGWRSLSAWLACTLQGAMTSRICHFLLEMRSRTGPIQTKRTVPRRVGGTA